MKKNTLFSKPDANGHFENFGGRYVAETLMPMLLKVEKNFEEAWKDKNFINEFKRLLKDYAGRPSPLWHAERLEQHFQQKVADKQQGAQIFFKRDELNHTGSHKINNVIGQVLLAKRMGLSRVIAETGAGQHGVATATVAALFGMKCTVHMGAKDIKRQAPNVFRMRLLGADIISCESGSASLKDAMNEALRDWVANVNDTYYVIGTVAGPHPYPKMVREFQKIIGEEVRQQLSDYFQAPRLPDLLIAAVGGGSNAMGLFYPFLDDPSVKMVGVESAGKGILSDKHAASISKGKPGVLHGNKTYLLQDDEGQILEAHSVSAGLDYPGIGPEHSWLHETGRVKYEAINDDEAIEAFQLCCRLEGIIPALEPSHALGYLAKVAGNMKREEIIVMNMCGRGDKDIFTVAEILDGKLK